MILPKGYDYKILTLNDTQWLIGLCPGVEPICYRVWETIKGELVFEKRNGVISE